MNATLLYLPSDGEVAIPDEGYELVAGIDTSCWGLACEVVVGRWDHYAFGDQRFSAALRIGPLFVQFTLFDKAKLR